MPCACECRRTIKPGPSFLSNKTSRGACHERHSFYTQSVPPRLSLVSPHRFRATQSARLCHNVTLRDAAASSGWPHLSMSTSIPPPLSFPISTPRLPPRTKAVSCSYITPNLLCAARQIPRARGLLEYLLVMPSHIVSENASFATLRLFCSRQ